MTLAALLGQVLLLPRSHLVTAVAAALCLSGVATACSGPARHAIRVPVPTTRASAVAPQVFDTTVVAPVTTQFASMPSDQVFVVIERVGDASRRVAPTTRDVATRSVQRVIANTGYATRWPERLPTSSELSARRCRGFIVASTIEKLDVTRRGRRTQIECTVSLRVAPWNGTDGGERWEANTSAIVRGSALATTGSDQRQIELAARDCLDSAIQAATSGHLVPFLRRISEPPR